MAGATSTSLGDSLRQQRLQQNLDLAAIAKKTRICAAILAAIEADRFDAIPGGAYRRHFISQYARALGMDGEAAVAEFRNQFEEPPLPLPKPRKRRHSPLWADLGWAALVVAFIAGAYQIPKNPHFGMKNLERALHEAVPQAETRGQASREADPAPPPTAPPATAAPAAAPAAAPPTPASPPATAVHVAFTATEPVWISVKCDGNTAYAGVLEASNSKTFDATSAVTAVVGNAGGLTVSVNGKPVGPLGARGEVQTVELTTNGARRIARRVAPADAVPEPQL
jgi:cytoskeletal protein RodZ